MLEWSEFARRLGRELAVLERDTILIVRERDESRHYVQAMREPDRLYAEAVSNNFLDGPLLLTLADEEVLSEAGWRPPRTPPRATGGPSCPRSPPSTTTPACRT
ncbi:TY-Chap domain-containing protein [Actinomadura keratinilytica]|uniref:TY-Chap domain-containing protein n=1 Tax=Actinomadura keratinilytica TaxID=547461 RepID=UPI0036208B5E